MIGHFRHRFLAGRLWIGGAIAVVLLGAVYLGSNPSIRWLGLFGVGAGIVILLRWPILGLVALVTSALVIVKNFNTGSDVTVNPATLLVPALLAIWVLDMVRRGEVRLALSRANRPLLLFLLAGLFSLLIGSALWDPAVPRSASFVVVQLAQWSIFAFSAGAFWLTGNLVRDEDSLRRLTFFFLALAGGLAILSVWAGAYRLVDRRVATIALIRSPFWMLLAALVGGQLLYNEGLSTVWRIFSLASLGAVLVFAFHLGRETASHWVAVGAVVGVLTWLRFPRLRWPAVVLLLILTVSGFLTSVVYNFAGGDAEWGMSGGSRLALTGRVLEVTMRNPITGLGPAAYRRYGAMEPLFYGRALWFEPRIASHNNYVDLFSHVGLLGLGLFFWFAGEVTLLGLRLRARYKQGFAAGYVNAMLAAWAGALVLMLFADWMLPFVYNISFKGFQASVLVWLFLGGLVSLQHMAKGEVTG